MAVQLILKNSSSVDRRPSANQLSNGEIALNYNAAGAFLTCRDTNGSIQQVGGVKVSETAPSTPVKQTLWLKPSTGTLSIYSGSSWVAVGAVTSVNGQAGAVTLTSADIGLGNVNNTTDLNKPISTATQNALNTKADLVGGKVPTSQLPSLAVSEYLGPAANQAAMLLLSGERGDWCIRTDSSSTFVLVSDGGSSIGDWQELATPASPVSSVNGYTGTVVLGASDVSAATTAQGVLADSALQTGDNISGLTNDENYINSAGAPVQSVNTQTGSVVLTAANVGAVDLTGDNMTGNLTLGTSNIVLNASNGSAEFTSINVDNLTLDASTLSASGELNIEAGGTSAIVFQTKDTNGSYTFRNTADTLNGRLQFNDITAQRTYKYPDADGTVVVKDSSTGALTVDNLTLDGSTLSSSSALIIEAGASGAINFKTQATNGDYRFYNTAETFYGSLRFNSLTADRVITIPDADGTVVVKDSSTGALSIDNLTLDGNTLSSSDSLAFQTSNVNGNYIFKNTAGTFNANLRFNNLTSNRSFNFPDNGGTVALTSDISDANLKENIVDAPSQWADVKATRVKNFYYTETSGQPSGKHIGWIAQEVQDISPGCVVEIPEEDEEGNPTDESCLAIKTQVMLVKAYKALQEAMERIETLEARLAAGGIA